MWTLAYGEHEDRTPTRMRQHGRPLCRHSLGAGTERRDGMPPTGWLADPWLRVGRVLINRWLMSALPPKAAV
jgi:hypothetical protein